MDIFNKQTFLRLAEVHQPHCVSIYLPTDRSGDKNQEKNRIRLKNRLKEAVAQLGAFGMDKNEAEKYLKPAYELADAGPEFWGRQSDGLAVFLHGGEIDHFELPANFGEITYVADHLYLQPLAGMLHNQGRHFILTVSVNDVHFFEATRHAIKPVPIEGLVPQSLTDAVGEDVVQNFLTFRTGTGGKNSPNFHAHGTEAPKNKKTEIEKYFRQLSSGLMEILRDESAPLVLACVDYLAPIYQEANTYKYLKPKHISGNHDQTDMLRLKELAWEIVKEDFDNKSEQARKLYGEFLSAGRASFNLEEIIPAAIGGRTDTLFLKKDAHIYGTYIPAENKVAIDQVNRVGNADLLNKAAVETVKNGGSVFLVGQEEMPDGASEVNAVFRY